MRRRWVARFDGKRVADPKERQDGSPARESAVTIVLEHAHTGLDGTGVSELAQRLGGSLAHQFVVVVESMYEGLDGAGVADLAQRPGGIRTTASVPVLEARDLGPDPESLDDRSEQKHRTASCDKSDTDLAAGEAGAREDRLDALLVFVDFHNSSRPCAALAPVHRSTLSTTSVKRSGFRSESVRTRRLSCSGSGDTTQSSLC